MGESGKAGGDVFLGVILLPSPSPHGEFGSSLHLVVRALTQVSRLQGSFYISVQSLSRVWLFATPWIAARQASLSITNSRSLLKLISIESVMPSNHLILCRPLLLLPSVFPSIRVFSKKSLSHPYMTTGKTIALTRWTFVGKVMSLLFNMLSRLVIAFLPRSKCLLISFLQPYIYKYIYV